jgi:hypothetical protein
MPVVISRAGIAHNLAAIPVFLAQPTRLGRYGGLIQRLSIITGFGWHSARPARVPLHALAAAESGQA